MQKSWAKSSLCFCALLRELPRVKDTWAMPHRAKFVAELRAFRYTASMELCVDTLCREGNLQLHAHMFLQCGLYMPCRLYSTHPLMYIVAYMRCLYAVLYAARLHLPPPATAT